LAESYEEVQRYNKADRYLNFINAVIYFDHELSAVINQQLISKTLKERNMK
jgi:hypothetical protein